MFLILKGKKQSSIKGEETKLRFEVFCEGGFRKGEEHCKERGGAKKLQKESLYYPRQFLQASDEMYNGKAIMCRTRDYKYVRRLYEEDEFYDLKKDPCELHNEIHNPPAMLGELRYDIREIIATLCKYKNVEIIEGAVCADHIHLCVEIPPKISISSFMGYLKGKSTLMIYDRRPELQSKWNKSFWARGYYVETIANITESAVKKYIQEQSEESRKNDE